MGWGGGWERLHEESASLDHVLWGSQEGIRMPTEGFIKVVSSATMGGAL